MKTKLENISTTTKMKKIGIKTIFVVIIFAGILLNSCRIEPDGRDGRAYISLEWNDYEPTYVDAGTSAIPEFFDYGRFYRISPGNYNIYYEGEDFYNGHIREYSWEMDYEIWVNEGKPRGYDGEDVYFTLELNPWGPENNYSYKTASKTIGSFNIIEKSDSKIVIEQNIKDFGIRVTYTKAKRKR